MQRLDASSRRAAPSRPAARSETAEAPSLLRWRRQPRRMAQLAHFFSAVSLLAACCLDASAATEEVGGGEESYCTKALGRHCPHYTIRCSSHRIGPDAPRFAAYGSLAEVSALIIEESPGLNTLGGSALIGLTRLASVNITLTGLADVDPGAFAPAAATLEDLTLSKNQLRFLRAATLARLSEIRYVDLSGNQLGAASLEWMLTRGDGFPRLSHLDLRRNAIRRLPPGAFARSPRLQTIRLDGNPLETLDRRDFEALADLAALTLRSRSLVCSAGGGGGGAGVEARRLRLQARASRSFAECAASNAAPNAASLAGRCLCTFRGCMENNRDRQTLKTCDYGRSRVAAASGRWQAAALEAALSKRARARLASTELELPAAAAPAGADPVAVDSEVAACELRRNAIGQPRGTSLTCQYKTNATVVFYCPGGGPVAAGKPSGASSVEGEAIRLFMADSYKYRAIASDSEGAAALYLMGGELSCVVGIFAHGATAPPDVELPRFTRCY